MTTALLLLLGISAAVSPNGNIDAGPALRPASPPLDSPAGWTPDTLLSVNDGRESRDPEMTLDSHGRFHVVWKDNRRIQGSDEIHYLMKDSTGWGDFMSLGALDTSHNSPSVAVDRDDNVHAVFLRWYGVPYAYYDVGYRRRDGATGEWGPEMRLTVNDSLETSARPQVRTVGDTVFVFWLRTRVSPPELGYIYNNGSGWSDRVNVTKEDAAPALFRALATRDGWVHVFWQERRNDTNQVWQRFHDGDSWHEPERVVRPYAISQPGIAADSAGNIHLAYGGGPSPDGRLHYQVWDRATRTWGNPDRWYSWSGAPDPRIGINRATGERHLTHVGFTTGWVLAYKRWDPGQQQWTDSTQLTWYAVPVGSAQPVLDSDGYVHLAFWSSHAGAQEEIVYKTNRVMTGIEERPATRTASRFVSPTVTRGPLRVAGNGPVALYDAAGARVTGLLPGPNDVSQLAPGIYFARTGAGEPAGKVVLRN